MQWSEGSSGSFEQAPAGTHIARCVSLIDIGTQHGEYLGESIVRRQCIVGWELGNELMQTGEFAGQPFKVSKFYTQSLHEKATLRKDLIGWRGRDFTPEELKGFDAKNILGKPCMLSVVRNDKGRSVVSSVAAMPKGMQAPDQVNASLYFSLDANEFSQEVFDAFSDKMRALISASDEWKARMEGTPVKPSPASQEFVDDDIPF